MAFATEQTEVGRAFSIWLMSAPPNDFRLVFHNTLPVSYENSFVMLARAGFDGTLQLLTAGWERVLGYDRAEFMGKNLNQLMWFNRGSAAAAVTAILDEEHMEPVHMRMCCRDGAGKGFRLHRHYDELEQMMYFLAEETTENPSAAVRARERRVAIRRG